MMKKPKFLSWWQRGCNDARARRASAHHVIGQVAVDIEPENPEPMRYSLAVRSYRNGYKFGLTRPAHQFQACGGCGGNHPDQRCIGCGHPFTVLNKD